MNIIKLIPCMALLAVVACKKNSTKAADTKLRYYEVSHRESPISPWQDTSFVIATSNPALIEQVNKQFSLPVSERRLVNGKLVHGDGGYNKNASHSFTWHFDENDWKMTDQSAEIYDGRPYMDIDRNNDYWFNKMGRFAPWGYYIKREITFSTGVHK